jgi:Amt family ammonium transporter
MSALLIGGAAGVICYLMVAKVKLKFGYDDSLDAFGVHGIGGTVGALLTGFLASRAVNPIFKNAPVGAIDGNWHQVTNQLIGMGIGWTLGAIGTLVILKVVDLTIGLRVSTEHEVEGLDATQHGEEGYFWEVSPS